MRNCFIAGCSCVVFLLYIFTFKGNAQCLTKEDILDSIPVIDNDSIVTAAKKLERFYSLKKAIDKCGTRRDSVYSNLLLKIAYYEVHDNRNFNVGIDFINASLRINMTGEPGSSKYFAAKGFYILAAIYYQLSLFDKAIKYFDSTILVARTFPDTTQYLVRSKLYKAFLLFQNGDYQKAIEESTAGLDYSLKKKDSSVYLDLLNQRAQSLYYVNDLDAALSDANAIIQIAERQKNLYDLASALKIKAYVFNKRQQFIDADFLFKKAISARIQTKDYEQIANDYIDYGNFCLDSLGDYAKARQCYLQTVFYGKELHDSTLLAKANTNIQGMFLKHKNYKLASDHCVKALAYLNITIEDIFRSPRADQLISVGAKEMALVIMNNKIETLLKLFLTNKSNNIALSACLQSCLVTDTLITKMRHIQSGNESKLYWRNYTRDFYANAIEAGYLAGKPDLVFYFMEKSRAVLLNDKLNELNASSYLSSIDVSKQEQYEIKIVELEQKLSALSDTSKQQQALQLQLLNIKDSLEQFIKSLEQKYPAYYQYKYADQAPSLQSLQQYLLKNSQNFVHYFLGDTVTYILAITPDNTKFIRLSEKEFNKKQLIDFLQFCASKQTLNGHYDSFAQLSNSIYKSLFRQLQLPKGRIIICTDNIVIPFDALCTDETGKHFLLNSYSFTYVYSARFLMKQFNNALAKGSFAGFAPVSFTPSLGVVDLKNAADALHASASYYKKDKLFTHQNASRNNFFNYASSYSVVSIFSHAFADTTDNEPVLFMQDSLIHLSELQLLKDPSTKLVLLSACQTNVGKAATGEGVYSLARGFAAAGIPSVAATLWKADEKTIYAVSEKFNQYLSEGMNKDEALQKAKLYFVQNNSSEKMLPYYWANMILIGNTDAISLTTTHNNYWWWIVCFLLITGIIMFFRKKNLLLSKIKK
ncbi:MAG TPA: CHAT domain-containing protein [Parafilimonas sp.]|nr:CHAT domain-containing protein [Parafilimonas sp.]